MRIFVTGATGFVGGALVQDLIAAGHQVIGLVRSAGAAATLTALGAEPHMGDLRDHESLRTGIVWADSVVHTAFNHDFSQFPANCEADSQTIEFLGSTLAGSGRPLVVTSAIGVLPKGGLVTEASDPIPAASPGRNPRAASEDAAARAADLDVSVSVVRLPLSVHGTGDHAFVPTLIGIAREKGVSAYIGDGENLWPAVHRRDAARVFRLAIEKGAAHGRYHAVAEEGVPFREIAAAIGAGLGVPVTSVTPEAAPAHFGWFHDFARINIRASSEVTQRTLGWHPSGPTLLEDLAGTLYFDA